MIIKNSISPIQIRPAADPASGPNYYWFFDNTFTVSPIIEDFNRDGKDDLIFLPGNYRTSTNSYDQDGLKWPTYKFIYYQSNGDGTFSDRTSQLFPEGQWVGFSATRYIYKDLNSDGIEDFIVIDQGYESIPKNPLSLLDMDIGTTRPGSPWYTSQTHQGAVLSWWEGTKSGQYVRHDITSDNYMAFHHNGDAADIDGDGQLEVVIANAGTFQYVTKEAISQFLNPTPSASLVANGAFSTRIEDSDILALGSKPLVPLDMNSTGDYRLKFDLLAQDDSQHPINEPNKPFQMLPAAVVKFGDVNHDGQQDMIVGSGVMYEGADTFNRIYINQDGKYDASNVIRLEMPSIATDPLNRNYVVFIDTADIDGNGLLDIVLGYENPGNGNGAGHFIQIYQQSKIGQFEDTTLKNIGSYTTSDIVRSVLAGKNQNAMSEPSNVRFEDINSDGHEDLVFLTGVVSFNEMPAYYLINDGLGHFAPISLDFFSASNLRKNLNDAAFSSYNYQSVVGDFNGDEVTDNLTLEYDFWGWSDLDKSASFSPAYMYVQTDIKNAPVSDLANGLSTNSKQVFGLNEWFYVNAYPEAQKAVNSGLYGSVAEYFEKVGQNRGDALCAPNSIVWGDGSPNQFIFNDSLNELHLIREGSGDIRITGSKTYETLSFHDVYRFQFDNQSLAMDVEGASGQAYRLYKAAFDRTPDQEGLGYWIDAFDHGADLTGVASSFIASPEFAAMYGANSTDTNFVTLLYNHVLHRDPDAEGNAYWLNALQQDVSRGSVLASFSESPENIAQTAQLIANGIQYQEWVG